MYFSISTWFVRVKKMNETATTCRHLAALVLMMDEIQRYFMNELEYGIAALPGHPESWAFVGMDTGRALAQLEFVRDCLREVPSPRFVDCGAGLGFIGMLARGLGFRPGGIELSSRYVEIANRLFAEASVAEGNVLDFSDYGEFDVIYYYGPFKDDAMQEQFEIKVERDAMPGAIIIANRKVSDTWQNSPDFRLLKEDGVGSWIFQKRR